MFIRSKGFTLIEISIVLVIIGIILGVVMVRSGPVIGNAKTTDTIAIIKDLTAAISVFKNRYHYLPGDLPKAADDISGVSAACNFASTTTNVGNGEINSTIATGTKSESDCVAEHLVLAGMIKGSTQGIFSRNAVSATTPDIIVVARRVSSTLPTTVINEIQLTNQPCETVLGLDSKLDDGDFQTGNVRASVTSCTSGGANDPVPFVDIAL